MIFISGIFEILIGGYFCIWKKSKFFMNIIRLCYLNDPSKEIKDERKVTKVLGTEFVLNGSIFILLGSSVMYFRLNFIISLILFILIEWLSSKRIIKVMNSIEF